MALTNVDLQTAVQEGRFREDLFFRLNVLTIHVPSLRERRADILPLAEHLLASLRPVHGRANVHLTEATRALLGAYSWPGNVRELRNAVERAVVFARSETLNPDDFPDTVRAAAPGGLGASSGMRTLQQVEKDVIAATLEATKYAIGESAKVLGISRKTLLEKRKRYGLK
jgi:DNA-binding NtrC family response regulator